MKMTTAELRENLIEGANDICFKYKEEYACICPFGYWAGDKRFDAGWRDVTKQYVDIDDVMSDPIYDGKSLNEIAEELDIYYG